MLPQNLKQALNDYCRVLDQAKKDGLVASRTGDDEEKPDYLPLERLAQGKALDGEEEDPLGQVYEDIACTSGETMKELLQRLEQGRIYRGDKVSETRVSHFQGAEFPAG